MQKKRETIIIWFESHLSDMYPAKIKPTNWPILFIVPTSVSFHRLASHVKSHCIIKIMNKEKKWAMLISANRKTFLLIKSESFYLVQYCTLGRIVKPRIAITSHVSERRIRTDANLISYHITRTTRKTAIDLRCGRIDPRWIERCIFWILAFRH